MCKDCWVSERLVCAVDRTIISTLLFVYIKNIKPAKYRKLTWKIIKHLHQCMPVLKLLHVNWIFYPSEGRPHHPSSWAPEQQLLPHAAPHLYSHPILSMSVCLLHKCRSAAFHPSLQWMFFMLLSWFVELRTLPVSWTLCQKPWPRYQQVFRN